jgi:hypothetical protein
VAAGVLMGNNDSACTREQFVPVRVVIVPVSVEDKPDRARIETRHGGLDLIDELGKLVVDEQDAVLADQDADIPPVADEHRDVPGDRDRLDLNLLELLRRR